MPETMRQIAHQVASSELDQFSLAVLGYDRQRPDADENPKEALEWVYRQRELQETRRKRAWLAAGAVATAILSAVASEILPRIVARTLSGFLGG